MKLKFTLVIVALMVVAASVLFLALREDGRRRDEPRSIGADKVPIGMMGDSDTIAYQDHVSFPLSGNDIPGGSFHKITLQWPEVLARIREREVDLGPWAVWGVPRWMSMARVRDGLGLPWRGPRHETHQHNLAWPSGCETLMEGPWRQTERLVDVMDEQPAAWTRGVVVIRMGVNNFGKERDLEALSRNPDDPQALDSMATCVEHTKAAIRMIHARHPQTRIVLVGIFNNSNWAPYLGRWQSAAEQANIHKGLDHYDDALRSLAASDPRLAFFDDRAWFRSQWGERDPVTGKPAYRALRIGGSLVVDNSAGDDMSHAVLGNLHAGLVWNALWTQSLVQLIRDRFGLPISAVSNQELDAFVSSLLTQVPAAASAP